MKRNKTLPQIRQEKQGEGYQPRGASKNKQKNANKMF